MKKIGRILENHGGKLSVLAFVIGMGTSTWHVLYYSGGLNETIHIPWNIYTYLSFGVTLISVFFIEFDIIRKHRTGGKITRKTFKDAFYSFVIIIIIVIIVQTIIN